MVNVEYAMHTFSYYVVLSCVMLCSVVFRGAGAHYLRYAMVWYIVYVMLLCIAAASYGILCCGIFGCVILLSMPLCSGIFYYSKFRAVLL